MNYLFVFASLSLVGVVDGLWSIFNRPKQPAKLSIDTTFVILPGFGNDQKDYINPLDRGEEVSFVSGLKRRNIASEVVNIRRSDWLKLMNGAASNPLSFVKGTCTPYELFSFYLDEVEKTVNTAFKNNEGKQVVLVGHSAGGWLARAYMNNGNPKIAGLVTLGTPHYPPIDKKNDATRGAIRYVDENFPGALLSPDVFYISIGGTAVTSISPQNDEQKKTIEAFAQTSYQAVTGIKKDGEVGDGVVPLSSTLLLGSQTLIFDVYHSIQAPNNRWYGGENVLDAWLPLVDKNLRLQREKKVKKRRRW